MTWTDAFGDGAGIVMIGIAWLIGKHGQHLNRLHHSVDPWLSRARILLMGMGGFVLLVTTIGQWVSGTPLHAIASAGGLGRAIAIVGTGAVLLMVVLGLTFGWSKAAIPALVLPFLLAMFNGGFYYNLDQEVAPTAKQKSSELTDWLGQLGSGGPKKASGKGGH